MKNYLTRSLLACSLLLITACSKKATPAPQSTTSSLLVSGGTWITTGAVLFVEPGGRDSLVVPSNSSILGANGAFLMSNVTFKSDGTATESDYAPGMTWDIDPLSSMLVVKYNDDTDVVTAIIASVSAHQLVLLTGGATGSFSYNGKTYLQYKQILTH